jgi:predicted DNA-binding antitoxin AbrB/MazE fold protein
MPLPPISVTLTDGQKVEALKRIRERYVDELKKLETDVTEILTQVAEAEMLAAYLGEQPEVKELRQRVPELEKKQTRREHLGKLMDRLEQIIPKQAEVAVPPPAGGKAGGVRRY